MVQKLLLELAEDYVKGLGLKELIKRADNPERDLHVGWGVLGLSYSAWLKRDGVTMPKKYKVLLTTTISGQRFIFWWGKD